MCAVYSTTTLPLPPAQSVDPTITHTRLPQDPERIELPHAALGQRARPDDPARPASRAARRRVPPHRYHGAQPGPPHGAALGLREMRLDARLCKRRACRDKATRDALRSYRAGRKGARVGRDSEAREACALSRRELCRGATRLALSGYARVCSVSKYRTLRHYSTVQDSTDTDRRGVAASGAWPRQAATNMICRAARG